MSLGQALERATGLVFVCSGNMIRSAFAELYARHLGCDLPLRSAATTYENDRLHPATRAALLARGVAREDIDRFRPTHIARLRESVSPGAVGFGMTRGHLAVMRGVPELEHSSFLLLSIQGRDEELEDPLHDGRFDESFATIASCVEDLVARL